MQTVSCKRHSDKWLKHAAICCRSVNVAFSFVWFLYVLVLAHSHSHCISCCTHTALGTQAEVQQQEARAEATALTQARAAEQARLTDLRTTMDAVTAAVAEMQRTQVGYSLFSVFVHMCCVIFMRFDTVTAAVAEMQRTQVGCVLLV